MRWVLDSCEWDAQTGRPSGPPQWPKGRSYLETPNRLVEAAAKVRRELGYVGKPERKKREPKSEQKAPMRRRRK